MKRGDLVRINAFGLYGFSRSIGIVLSGPDRVGYLSLLEARTGTIMKFLPGDLVVLS